MTRFKLEIPLYSFWDHTSLEKHLQAMAAKGWFIRQTGALWAYSQGEPAQCRYEIGYYPNAGVYAPSTPKETAFDELCESAGWEIAAEQGPLKIFCSKNMDAVSLDTDPVIQTESIRLARKKTQRANLIVSAVYGVIALIYLWFWMMHPAAFFHNTFAGWFGRCAWITSIMAVTEEITFYTWYKKALRNAREQEAFTPTRSFPQVTLLFLALIAANTLWYATTHPAAGLLFILCAVLLFIGWFFMEWSRLNLRRNRTPGWVVFAVHLLIGGAVFVFYFMAQSALGGF